MMHKVLVSLLFVASAASVASAVSEVELDRQLKAKEDSLASKRGFEVGGRVIGVLNNSYMSSDQDNGEKNKMPNVERSQFVSADLDLHFRPYEAVRFNATLRLEAGMQNYFATSAKSLTANWLNVEGNVGSDFYWIAGDFRQQYSPLTLFAPTGIDGILYEPLIFARAREMAMQEAMIVGNQRNLQGVNLQFRHDFGGMAGELRAEGIFARIRRVSLLDFSGSNGNLLTNGYNPLLNGGEIYEGSSMASNMDKWVLSGNIEYLPANKNVILGFTGMTVFDDSASFTNTWRPKYQEVMINGQLSSFNTETGEYDGPIMNPTSFDNGGYTVYQPINPYETAPQSTSILAFRGGVDVAGFLGDKNLTLDLMGEYAMSSDEVHRLDPSVVLDEMGNPVLDAEGNPSVIFKDVVEDDNGNALNVNLNAGYKLPMGLDIQLSANYIMNDSNWFNNLAQSPQFFATRTLNSDKDGNVIRYGVNAPLYSTFSSLYFFDPKFTPVGTQLANTDDPNIKGQTNSYNIAPIQRNSYGTSIYTRRELALMSSMLDPALQMSLPNGLATANRKGVQANLKIGFDNYVEASALFSTLKQDKSDNIYLKEAEFTEFGGGLKWDIFKMLGFTLPLEISGSYKHSVKTQELNDVGKLTFESDAEMLSDKGELKMDFINAGLYVQYMPRLGINAGFQMIDMTFDAVSANTTLKHAPGYKVPLMKGKQMQWMVGLDYTVAEGVYLELNYGIINVKNTYDTSKGTGFQKDDYADVTNLPDYADVTMTDADGNVVTAPEYKHEFSQAVVQAILNVNF